MAEPKALPADARLNELLDRSVSFAPLVVVGGAIALGLARGPGAAVLTLAGGVMVGAISALWSSLRVLSGEAPLSLHEAIELGTPSASQEQKARVLLAIKDLKREYSIGKISDDDFRDLMTSYRAEATQLLHQMDNDLAPARQKAEALLAARLAGQPSSHAPDDEVDEKPATAPKKKRKKGAQRESAQASEPAAVKASEPAAIRVGDASEATEAEAERGEGEGSKVAR